MMQIRHYGPVKGAGRRMASHSKQADHFPLVQGRGESRYERVRINTRSVRHHAPIIKRTGKVKLNAWFKPDRSDQYLAAYTATYNRDTQALNAEVDATGSSDTVD